MTEDNTNPQVSDSSELEELREQLTQMTEMAKRNMADFQNYKRRMEEQKAELQVYANMKLLNAIFPALDNFARAFEHIPEELKEHEFIKGIQATEKSLIQSLESLGLEAIDKTGIPVDPNRHEILMEGEGPAGQVVQVFEKGYQFNGKTIKAARVMVGRN